MVKYIFWAIVVYLLIRFVFNFLLPVFRATKQMRDQVKDFHHKMEEQRQQQGYQGTAPQAKPQAKAGKEDYIDFEEIK